MIYQIRKCVAAGAVVAGIGFGAWHFTKGESKQCSLCPTTAVAAPAPAAKAEDPAKAGGASDHVMFGGTPGRNMVNHVDKDIPGSFKVEEVTKWKAQLGSRSYAGPTVA